MGFGKDKKQNWKRTNLKNKVEGSPGLSYSNYLKRHINNNNKINAIFSGGGVIETKLQNEKSQIFRKAFYNIVVQSVSIYRSITIKNINRIELFKNMPYRRMLIQIEIRL